MKEIGGVGKLVAFKQPYRCIGKFCFVDNTGIEQRREQR